MGRSIHWLLVFFLPISLAAENGRLIVRTVNNQDAQVASDHGLTQGDSLPTQGISLLTAPDPTTSQQVLSSLQSDPRVRRAELDRIANVPETSPSAQLNQSTAAILDLVFDSTPVTYFGSQAPNGYVNQPAAAIIHLNTVQNQFGKTGAGVVAIIDTGVDPNHGLLQGVLVPGYDFTRDAPGIPSELADLMPGAAAMLNQSTAAILDQTIVAMLNQSTAAILDQSTAAILDTSQLPAAFGHGTMVAGIVHLVAPTASIMPLKAFQANGTASLFDIIRAIYYAVDNGADVINLSFNLTANSGEFTRAINYAQAHNVIVVASAGNSADRSLVFPAGLKSVLGVASLNPRGGLSKFSNYGSSVVDIGAPGEGIITAYPGNHYAIVSGTSFSAPLVSGGTTLLVQVKPDINYHEALEAYSSDFRQMSMDTGYGRLDLARSVGWLQQELAAVNTMRIESSH